MELLRQQRAVETIIAALPDPRPTSRRVIVALAGPPASGKSTLAAALRDSMLNAAVLGMDAFHFDNQVLASRGDLGRKGAPHTFDVDGYAHCLRRLRSEPTHPIAIPEFDRSLELTRHAAAIVSPQQNVVITEGNYLLLDRDPWTALAPLFDLTVWLDVAWSTIEERISERWLGHGLSAEDAARRLATNDGPNARLVQNSSRLADVVISDD